MNKNKDDSPGAPAWFPDWKTCRVQRSFLEGFFECAGLWQSHCPHCVTFGDHHFCRHPAAQLIWEGSQANGLPMAKK
ncbi:MAG TPA: hypothetical protein VF988_17015 [Verrucomicrobiae bacterium]